MEYQPLSPDFLKSLRAKYDSKIKSEKQLKWVHSYELCSNSLINHGFSRTPIENCIDILKNSEDSGSIKYCQGKSIVRAELWSRNNFTNLYVLFDATDQAKISLYYSQGSTIDEYNRCSIYAKDGYVSATTKTYLDKFQLDAIKLITSGKNPESVFEEIENLTLRFDMFIGTMCKFELSGENLFLAIMKHFFPR
jgi:hypothetical protein